MCFCIKREKNSIYDFEAKISFDGKYSLDFIPSLKLSDECILAVSLYDDEKLITSKSVNVSPSDIQKISFENLDVHPWSAECPYLYDMIVTLSMVRKLLRRLGKISVLNILKLRAIPFILIISQLSFWVLIITIPCQKLAIL